MGTEVWAPLTSGDVSGVRGGGLPTTEVGAMVPGLSLLPRELLRVGASGPCLQPYSDSTGAWAALLDPQEDNYVE